MSKNKALEADKLFFTLLRIDNKQEIDELKIKQETLERRLTLQSRMADESVSLKSRKPKKSQNVIFKS